ncbi:MAG: DNA-deoxyinosine glycosylase, partial [Methylococcales bacterium]
VLLTRHRIALWDVLRICLRNGSLDSSIQASSILSNDFCSFFRSASDIKAVFLNGATAEREYRKRVYPSLPEQYAKLPAYRLPSTSPAMAGMTREQKIERWRLVAEVLGPAA